MSNLSLSLAWLVRGLHLLGFLVSVLVLGSGWATGRLFWARTSEMRTLAREAMERIEKEPEFRESHRRLTASLQDAHEEVATLEARLTNGPEEVTLITLLSELSKGAGLRIKGFRPGHRSEREGLGELELRLSCEGSYEALRAFLSQLETIPRLCHVSSLNVSPTNELGSEVAVELQLHVSYRGQPSSPIVPTEVQHAT